MDLEETVRLEQDSLTQAMVLKHAEETRRAQRAALRPPSNAEARAMGLTEEEKKARIMAFMLVIGTMRMFHALTRMQELQGLFG